MEYTISCDSNSISCRALYRTISAIVFNVAALNVDPLSNFNKLLYNTELDKRDGKKYWLTETSEWWMVDNSYDYWCFPSACPRSHRWARYSTMPRRSRPCSSPPPVYHRVRSRSRVHWDSNQPRRGQQPRRCTIRVARSFQSHCIHRARFSSTFDRSRRNRYSVASCYSALLDTTHETSSHVRLNREARSAITVIKLRTVRFPTPLSPARNLIALSAVTTPIGISWLSHF